METCSELVVNPNALAKSRFETASKRASDEAQETRRALQWAKDRLRLEGNPSPKLSDLIWRALQDAAEQLARMPDRERTWLLSADRSIWPELARPSEENRQVEAQIQNEIEILGIRSPDEWRPHLAIEHPDTDRMLTVLGWLQHVNARSWRAAKRDKLVTLALAQGQSVKTVRYRFMRTSTDRAAYMVRSKVLANIADKIWRYWK